MREIKPGDIVTRKSYGGDVLFRVKEIMYIEGQWVAVLKGLEMRLAADAPVGDLHPVSAAEILDYRHANIHASSVCFRRILQRREGERMDRALNLEMRGEPSQDFFEVPGRVVHLDGDPDYLEKCSHAYGQLGINAKCFHVPEAQQAVEVTSYLLQFTPDILVLTGHDGFTRKSPNLTDIKSYRSSGHFVQAVRAARAVIPGKDTLVIFAGACQSHYEALLEAGANFASSPKRVLIHAYDPVYVVERVAFTPIAETVSLQDLVNQTITGTDGIGGVETKGRYRLGYPRSPY